MYKLLTVSAIIVALSGCDSDDPVAPDILVGSTYSACAAGFIEFSWEFTTSTTGMIITNNNTEVDCSGTNTSTSAEEFTYTTGATIAEANDGNDVTEFTYVLGANPMVFNVLRLSGGVLGISDFHIGNPANSSTGRDGTSADKRLDGLDLDVTYTLQP